MDDSFQEVNLDHDLILLLFRMLIIEKMKIHKKYSTQINQDINKKIVDVKLMNLYLIKYSRYQKISKYSQSWYDYYNSAQMFQDNIFSRDSATLLYFNYKVSLIDKCIFSLSLECSILKMEHSFIEIDDLIIFTT